MNATLRTGMLATTLAVAMGGVGYASVPLYRLFCQVTGFGGTTQMAIGQAAPGAIAGKTISVRFDANHAPGLPWKFHQEANRRAILAAAEAMIKLLGRTDRETGCFLTVKGAQPHHVGAALFKLHVVAHDIDNIDAVEEILNEGLRDHGRGRSKIVRSDSNH